VAIGQTPKLTKPMIDLAFAGQRSLGGVQMRGVAVAEALRVPFFDLSQLRKAGRIRTLILVKAHGKHAATIRQACERLIYDPLDAWYLAGREHDLPEVFWRWTHEQLWFDDIIATSPACAETMTDGLPGIPVHLAPHHADPTIKPGYDPDGPVVYSGAKRYLGSELPAIKAACKRLGKRLVLESGKGAPKKLVGASLVLHVRMPPHDTPLNRWCKPQVKLENAAAAGIPVLASDHPSVTSLRPEVTCHRDDWHTSLLSALDAAPLTDAKQLPAHCLAIQRILTPTDG
jgi:hypothetical protein